jgi:hypothetical protein
VIGTPHIVIFLANGLRLESGCELFGIIVHAAVRSSGSWRQSASRP